MDTEDQSGPGAQSKLHPRLVRLLGHVDNIVKTIGHIETLKEKTKRSEEHYGILTSDIALSAGT